MNPPNVQRSSGLAIASLVLGMSGLLTVGAGVGVLLALRQIKKSSGAVTGDGLATGGLVAGYSALALCTLSILATIFIVNADAGRNGRMLDTLSNGKLIFMAQYGRVLDPTLTGKDSGWPKSADFPTSTAVFTNLVDSGALRRDYSFFSSSGLTPLESTNAALFHPGNNAWCFVADLNDDAPDQIPVLFTRNLCVSNLAELQGRVGDQLSDDPPFGRKRVAMVFKGGYAQILKPDMLWSNLLGGRTFTNRVLRP